MRMWVLLLVGCYFAGNLMQVPNEAVQEQICASIISLYSPHKTKYYGDGEPLQHNGRMFVKMNR